MSRLRDHAKGYADLGWQLVPVIGKQPLIPWKDSPGWDRIEPFLDDPATTGIAVILGQPSGGLIVRDFDEVESYLRWCDEFPELAARLPKAETPRPGRHVFGRSASPCYTLKFQDGELRGDGSIVVLPPSSHPNGLPYCWLTGPFCEIPIIEPSILIGPVQQQRQTEWIPQEGIHPNTCTQYMACVNLDPSLFIDWAIEQTRPIQFGQRNRRIFDFARYLRTVYNKTTDPEELRPHVETWYRVALPTIGTKGFGETWRDFVHAWGSVELPAGASLGAVERLAEEDSFTLGTTVNLNLDRVARLLRAAARNRGADGIFYMSFRTMGRCVGLSAVAARDLALKLVDLGLLAIVEKGTRGKRGKATVWRWLGPLD